MATGDASRQTGANAVLTSGVTRSNEWHSEGGEDRAFGRSPPLARQGKGISKANVIRRT